MVTEMPLFPLNLVVFPDEELNLHIFEPRYKDLINDCLETQKSFGIPSYVKTHIEYGTEVKIIEVSKLYTDGRMDIKCRGLKPFKVREFQNPWANHAYAGGKVELLDVRRDASVQETEEVLLLIEELFRWLHMDEEATVDYQREFYYYIHKIGLKPEEEYDLLMLPSQRQQLKRVKKHLDSLIPALERAEKAREKIRLNGHFKHFDPLKF